MHLLKTKTKRTHLRVPKCPCTCPSVSLRDFRRSFCLRKKNVLKRITQCVFYVYELCHSTVLSLSLHRKSIWPPTVEKESASKSFCFEETILLLLELERIHINCTFGYTFRTSLWSKCVALCSLLIIRYQLIEVAESTLRNTCGSKVFCIFNNFSTYFQHYVRSCSR